MTTYYGGATSAGAANGTSWANRWNLSTSFAAWTAVAAATDVLWLGPGVYRATMTLASSGSSGSPITVEGDITGRNTDGVGGIVRITGSDNDTTATRANCILASVQRNYWTFRGILFDTTTSHIVSAVSPQNWIIEDCYFGDQGAANFEQLFISGASQSAVTVRRCVFPPNNGIAISFTHSAVVDNAGHLVENCVIFGQRNGGVRGDRVGGVTVRNCYIFGQRNYAVGVQTALTVGQTWTANNNIIVGCATGLRATLAAEFVDDYNTLWANTLDRSNVTPGGNSVAFPPLMNPIMTLLAGFNLPQFPPFSLSEWSQVKAKAGTGTATDDLLGLTRPATAAKLSWGPQQYVDAKRDTGTVRTGTASMKLADAGLKFVRRVWVTAVSTTISLYVRWEADYVGTKPRMVLRQAGQADRTTTATGAAGAWEQLTDTLTPAALPGFVDVFVESSNTASATSFATYVDDLVVS